MAELEGLYLGMGIDTSQLDSDFVDAEKTISENISRINREMQLVQIRGQIELNGLDESAESIEKLKIQEEALMAQMGLQQDKIVLLSAAYEKLSETRGVNAESTQQVEMQLAREQLALQKLEQQMEDLSEQEKIALGINFEMLALIEPAIAAIDSAVAAGTAMPIPHAKATAVALIGLGAVAEGTREATEEMRENNPAKVLDEDFQTAAVSIDESWQQAVDSTHDAIAEMETSVNEAEESLSDMKILPEFDSESLIEAIELLESESLGESLRKANDLIAESDSLIGKFAASVLGLGTVFSQIDEPIIEFAQTAIENFKELKQVANELNLSILKASDLVSKINLSGADYNDVRDFVRGVQDAVIKGDSEDPEVLALERYGVAIQDAQGKLLAFDETLDRLYQGYLKAREAGEAEAYIIMTNGQAVQDVLPYFENLARAEEDMAKIKWSTIDIATLQEAVRDSKLLETQVNEFQNALSSLAAPAADIALKNAFEIFKTGTELIEENREAVIYWTFVLMEGTNAITEFAKEIGDTAKNKIIEFTDSLKELEKEFGIIDTLKSFLPDEWLESPDENSIFSRAQKRLEDFIEANEKAQREIKKTAEEVSGLSYSLNRIAKYKSELEGLTLDKQFGSGESYRKSLGEINLWREEALRDAKYYADEQAAIEELYSAKLEKIEQERADKIAEIHKSVDAEFKTSLQNRLEKIEEEKQAWIKAGMEEAEAESLAQKQLSDYIKSVEEELSANIEALHQTDLEKRIAQIEREKQAWIDKGASASQAEQFAQEKIRQENQKTEDKLNQIRNSVAALYKTDLENKLDAIETEKKAWIEAGMEEVEAEELAQQKIQHIKEEYLKQQAIAEAEYLDKLAKAEEEYLSKVQAAQEEADRKNKARRDEALNVAKQEAKEFEAYLKGGYEGLQKLMYNKLIKSGVNPELLKAMTPEKLDAYENAKEKATQSFLPNWKDPYEPNMPKKPVVEIPDILVKVPQSAENTARSLDNLATSADKAANNLGGGGEPFAPAENVWTGDSSGAVASYRQPDGSVKIENYYDSVKKAEPIINVVGDGSQNESSNYTVLEQSSQELSTAVQSTTESLGELPTIVQGVSASLSEIMGRYSELPDASAVSQSFSEMPTVIQTAIDSFRDLPITISDVTEKLSSIELPQFYDMSQSVQEVTIGINDFSNALSNFLSNVSYNGTTSEQKTPVNVNTSVQIEEAHAWDYDHIQELAEKVADILKPEIIRAIGGDSNSY